MFYAVSVLRLGFTLYADVDKVKYVKNVGLLIT